MTLDFLTLHPEVFGLDLSDLSLKIAKFQKKGRGLSLVSYGNFPLPEGLLSQGEIQENAQGELAQVIRDSLKKVSGKKLNTPYVVASLPEEKAFLRVIQLPFMKQEEVLQAVSFELENYIPYSPETVYVDTQIVPALQNPLDHLDVLLAALPRGVVDSYLSLFKSAGLIPQVFEIESLSCARSLIPHGVSPWPVLLVDLGATRTSFIVFAGYSLRFTASIAVSSGQLTASVAKALGVSKDTAEELKKRYGLKERQSKEGRAVFDAIVPALVDLVEQIKRYREFYQAHASHQHLSSEEMRIRKVLLAGGGASLPGLREFLEQELKTEISLGNPWVNTSFQLSRQLPPLKLNEALGYTTALGLALRGFSHD